MQRRWLEPSFLGVVITAALALWAFLVLAEEVGEGETGKIDAAILLGLHPTHQTDGSLEPRWLWEFARDITGLGSIGVLALIVLAAFTFLLLARRTRAALFVLAATSLGAGISALLKLHFNRARPDLIAHNLYVVGSSFPSGHAMMSVTVYLTLGAVLSQMTRTRRLKLYILCTATLLSGLIGISRVYLGVHWPSDVLAGWAAGATWALGAWGAAHLVHLEQEAGA